MLADAFVRSGKVRDLYELADRRMLLVASDRISAFDVVLPNVVPDKGRVLTGLSRFWFAETRHIVANHLLGAHPGALADGLAAIGPVDELRGRIMVCRAARVLPIEAVVRGYLAGSGWKEYRDRGSVCGIPLPAGLRESDRLPEPLFTPATKAEAGAHDENIGFDAMIDHLGVSWPLEARADLAALAALVRDISIRLYRHAASHAERRGLILADTKFEFGLAIDDERQGAVTASGVGAGPMPGGEWPNLLLIDEALTPDSSRFWDAAAYLPGGPQASFDKQFVRDWLERQPWDKTAPGPELPGDVVDGTRRRYVEAYERITGASFQRYLDDDVIAA